MTGLVSPAFTAAPVALRVTLWAVAGWLWTIAFWMVWQSVRVGIVAEVAVAAIILFGITPFGLLRLANWARMLTIALLWAAAFSFLANISTWSAMEAGRADSVGLAGRLAVHIPATLLSLVALHVMGKHKTEFQKELSQ